jgi:hypothetical protein
MQTPLPNASSRWPSNWGSPWVIVTRNPEETRRDPLDPLPAIYLADPNAFAHKIERVKKNLDSRSAPAAGGSRQVFLLFKPDLDWRCADDLVQMIRERGAEVLPPKDPDLDPFLNLDANVEELRCPYPGLRPFDQSDTEFFFGRDRQISELIARLKTQRFVGVVGFSGSGKSPLVLAGLLPALRAGQLGPSDRWRIAILRPSPNPVATLAGALDQALGAWPERERKLQASTFGLLEGTTEGRGKEVNLLVVVDQFEDLFRLVEEGKLDAQHAAHFINLLLTVARRRG